LPPHVVVAMGGPVSVVGAKRPTTIRFDLSETVGARKAVAWKA